MPIRILKKDKNKSEPKKRFDPRTGEETNKPGGKDPRTIYRPKPDVKPTEMKTGGLSPKQKAIASKAPPPDKIDGKDFAVLKAEKAKGRGMGLQDEKIKPGKVMKAALGAVALGKAMKDEGKAMPLGFGAVFQKNKKMKELLGKKSGGVMKANKGKMTPIKKDPTTPVNPFEKRRKQLGGGRSKLPGKIGTALGIGAMMVPAAYAAAKQYKDYKSAKNRDKAKVKKMGGGMMQKPMGYKSGTMVKARGCKLGRSKPTKMY